MGSSREPEIIRTLHIFTSSTKRSKERRAGTIYLRPPLKSKKFLSTPHFLHNMDDIDYTQPLVPYTFEDYILAWYICQRETFVEALDFKFRQQFEAEMSLLPLNPLPSPEELYLVEEDDFTATTVCPSDMPPWPLTSCQSLFFLVRRAAPTY